MEETILGSQEKSVRLEYQLFLDIRGSCRAGAPPAGIPPRPWPWWTPCTR